MKLLSLDWFRSEKKKHLEDLKVEEQTLKNQILKKDLEQKEKQNEEPPLSKLYKKLKLVNNVLTIVLQGGEIISKTNATPEDFQKAKEASRESDLFKIASSSERLEENRQQAEELKKAEILVNGIKELENLEDFEIREGSVYLKGINRSVPQLLVEKFMELQDKYESNEHFTDSGEYQALKKFWLKCCLNPNAKSAEDLYIFLSHHQFKIDKHGNFYAYRRVVSKEGGDKSFVEFISNTYNKVKAVWKKNPSKFSVYSRLGDFKLIENSKPAPKEDNPYWNLEGVLEGLYLNLPNIQEKMYTSAHTGLEDYRVGSVITMPRNDGDDNNNISCSKGFHAASKEYDYRSFGDTPILMIINPMDVLAVPQGEVGKLRTCRWFFASVLSNEEEHILDDEDFDVSDLGDVFEEKCLENLEEHIQLSFAEEVKRHTFTIPSITATEIHKIVSSLEEMKASLANRVVQFD